MPPIVKPFMRRLHCRDPQIVENYTRRFVKLAQKAKLLEKVTALDQCASYPYKPSLSYTYKTLDAIRCEITSSSEKKCRKLRTGQVAFSPALQNSMKTIRAWSLLIKKHKGEKVSSRLLARTLNQSGITQSARELSLKDLNLSLKEAYQDYYKLKAHHHALRQSYLYELAEALAESQKTSKETLIRQLIVHESQRKTARKIRYL
jgi:hypothetical protein